MSKCDIKDSSQAWNDGVEAFKKAFLSTGGKPTESLNFAMREVNSKHPDFDFETQSFTNPIVSSLKGKGVIDESYQYKGKKEKKSAPDKKIDRIVDKMKGVPADKKKGFARKVYESFNEDGLLTDERVKNLYAEALGLPSTDKSFDPVIEKTAKDLQIINVIDEKVKDIYKDIQEEKTKEGKLSKEKNKEFSDQLSELSKQRDVAIDEHLKSSLAFAQKLQDRGFWMYNLADFIRMNLMNPVSLLKNITGAGFDAVFKTMVTSIASPISQLLLRPITKINSNPIGARIRGLKDAKILKQAGRTFKYGTNNQSNEIRRVNHLDAVAQLRKAMQSTGTSKVKNYLAAILKMHPDLIGRFLGAPDAAFFEKEYSQELNRISESKGLKGAEKQAFLMNPDEKSVEIATESANESTFKSKLPDWLEKFASFNPKENEKKLIKKGYNPTLAKILSGLKSLSLTVVFPFIKTPLNIVRSSSKILLPELVLTQSIIEASKEFDLTQKQKILLEGTATAAVGFFIRNVALQMVSQGLISAGYSDEDKKTKDNVEQKNGGPNRINYSAFVRGMMFQDMTERKGDRYADLNSLGVTGIVMGAYAHAYNQYSKDDIEQQTQYTKNWTNAFTIPMDALSSEFSATLDYTFFSGFNQIERMVKNEQGYERKQYFANLMATAFGGIAPSTYQKLSTQKSQEVKKQFDKDLDFWGWHGNLANTFGYRFFFDDKNLKNKYFSLAEKEGGGIKKKQYMLFDNYFGRVLQAEFGVFKSTDANMNGPVPRLYNASREVDKDERDKMFPAAISDKISIQSRRGGKTKSQDVQLTNEQHDYIQEQASNYRMMLATPFIMSPDFNTTDFETKSKVLQALYQEGLKYAKKDLVKAYPDIKYQKVEGQTADKKAVKKLVRKYKS